VPGGVAYLPSSRSFPIGIIEKSGSGSRASIAKSARMSLAVALTAL
jgi:hypothetical protein